MKSNKKLLTRIIIAVIGCVLAATVTACALLSGNNINGGLEDNSVSSGYVSTGGGSAPCVLTPYFCAYRFETNVYEANSVNCKVSYAIDGNVFKMCYEDLLYYNSQDTITEYNIYLLIVNGEVAGDLFDFRYNREPEYAQRLKGLDTGTAQNGVYIHERFEFKDLNSFPFDRYDISIYWEKEQKIREFAHTEEIIVPEQLFVGDSGCISICLEQCVTFGSGKVDYLGDTDNVYFHYLKEGDQVKISRTRFR